MKKETSSKALILKSTPFKDNKVILYLFSEVFGLVSAMYTTKKQTYLSSMMYIEGNLRRGRSDMYNLSEAHILDAFPNLRTDFDLLQLSSKMIGTLSKTLVKDRPVPPLFVLTKNTLKAFSKEVNNQAIYHCYLLKLLLFEGLLPLNPEDMEKAFSEEEKHDYLNLATAKSFESLEEISITPRLQEAIENYTLLTLH